eukprot:CAMPEP_0206401002 /NCGR_PEP_ID=MMETSP0294-20121207/25945_1 /ASSEMBLY_ACC=CAM_ASM_000327 /TAXON_ID=39354 /ORGANISM="Heterosigma akashiwo, Strain CCMP2393" /LENGTH=37 /DNA_ID= /DNA_START= /DNA_END= /DNA_ORIENTATION=
MFGVRITPAPPPRTAPGRPATRNSASASSTTGTPAPC